MCVIAISFNCIVYMHKLYTSLWIKYLPTQLFNYWVIININFFFFLENNIILILNQDELLFDVDVMDIKVLHV